MRAAMIAASVLVLAACNMAAGAREAEGDGGGSDRRDFAVGAFDRVSLLGAQDVVVTLGGAPSVRAEGNAAALDRLEVTVEGGELRIGHRRDRPFSGNSGKATVHVTVPSLSGASIKGSGNMRIDRVEGADFDAGIAGSGDLEVGAMQVGTARVSIAGSGAIRAAGRAEQTEISVDGSGEVALARLQAKRAKVSIAGSGDVAAYASESADVSIRGSGDVRIAGSAKCTVRNHGSGSVECGG